MPWGLWQKVRIQEGAGTEEEERSKTVGRWPTLAFCQGRGWAAWSSPTLGVALEGVGGSVWAKVGENASPCPNTPDSHSYSPLLRLGISWYHFDFFLQPAPGPFLPHTNPLSSESDLSLWPLWSYVAPQLYLSIAVLSSQYVYQKNSSPWRWTNDLWFLFFFFFSFIVLAYLWKSVNIIQTRHELQMPWNTWFGRSPMEDG